MAESEVTAPVGADEETYDDVPTNVAVVESHEEHKEETEEKTEEKKEDQVTDEAESLKNVQSLPTTQPLLIDFYSISSSSFFIFSSFLSFLSFFILNLLLS